MKLSERLLLIKSGYSKDEINALIEEEKQIKNEPDKAPEPKQDNDMIKAFSVLSEEIKKLKQAVHKTNIDDTQLDDNNKNTIDEILASVINPVKDKKEE